MSVGKFKAMPHHEATNSGREVLNCLSERNARRLATNLNNTLRPVMESFNQDVLDLLQR
ncbi:MAG: hypothetical protein AB8E87_06675 [Prochlorococcus sp.]